MRQAEWLLADAAHRLPTGSYPVAEQDALAHALDQLAHAIRLRRSAAAEQPAVELPVSG
ncbi:hypothetical protein [Gandjariella thermophila]|uniref:Uncharacterized protein n=1 Tax=Gandjariella thermophila TaxID=1931992 RepID=A0A4D4J335_9PSEU|nr:hypothetical protein [Gandjariella thermophila]GDY29854.1 hypothetical protein GTS_14870 [Gandjariella thermophila]